MSSTNIDVCGRRRPNKDSGEMEVPSLSCWEDNVNGCQQFLENPSFLQNIHFLNHIPLHDLSDHQLVRFRGMVQDMYDPEIYLEKYEIKNTTNGKTSLKSGKFRDTNHCNTDEEFLDSSPQNVNSERQVLYCISIPATNSWVTHAERSRCTSSGLPNLDVQTTAPSNEKRSIEEMEDSPMSVEVLPSSSLPTTSECDAKRLCSASKPSNESKPSQKQPFNLNLPLPDPEGKACIVKVYDSDMKLALNDVLEVVGFLSLDPYLSTISDDLMDIELMSDHHPPPSLVPRLHAVSVKKLPHCNPLVPLHTLSDEIIASAKSAHEDLRLVLTQLLLGDDLAADFLICHLLSTVYLRRDMMPLGQLSLNIFNIPLGGDYIKELYGFLETIVTNSHLVPMTLDNLNTASFIPKKDYTSNRLSSGVLQLCAHTHIVLDETALQAGQLNTTGVHNMAALRNVITQQKVDYDFQYYRLEFETNLPVLVLSEGKSMLPCDVSISLEPDATCLSTMTEIFQAARHYLQDSLLTKIRAYITAMKHVAFEMPDNVQEKIQSDFVEMRKSQPSTSAADLHVLLVLSRLVSLSRGETNLSLAGWDLAHTMIRRQKERRGPNKTSPS